MSCFKKKLLRWKLSNYLKSWTWVISYSETSAEVVTKYRHPYRSTLYPLLSEAKMWWHVHRPGRVKLPLLSFPWSTSLTPRECPLQSSVKPRHRTPWWLLPPENLLSRSTRRLPSSPSRQWWKRSSRMEALQYSISGAASGRGATYS